MTDDEAGAAHLMTAPCNIGTATEAAQRLGYTKPTAAFYARLSALGVRSVWRGRYNLTDIDAAIDRCTAKAELDEVKSQYASIDYG